MTPTDVLANTMVSGELLALLPDLGRCELVEGRIVRMTPTGPRHGGVEQQLSWLLRNFLEAHPLGKLYVGEVGIFTKRDPDTVRGADVAYFSHERLELHDPDAAFFTVAPDVVIEILSPSERAQAVETKVREYLEAGAIEVWVVDTDNRLLRRHRAEPPSSESLDESQTLVTPVLPGLELPVREIFAE